MEKLIINAASRTEYNANLTVVRDSCHSTDFNFETLNRQLLVLHDLISQDLPTIKQVTTVRTICQTLNSKETYKSLFSEVHNLIRLFLTIPITSSTSERSFSTLRRLCNYVRSTMTEKRLNNCFLVHVHKELSKEISPVSIAKEFVERNDERKKYFGVYQ